MKKTLDWDYSADLDLERISIALGTNWEIDYPALLGFAHKQVADLKHDHRFDPIALLKYVNYSIH